MKRLITISFPQRKRQKLIFLNQKESSPYKMVEVARKNLAKALDSAKDIFGSRKIAEIIPIHNATGIRDPKQIKVMEAKIGKGEDVYEKDGLPNIKLIVTPDQGLLLFDGTHSMVAYFNQNKEFLREVPYLVLSGDDYSPVSSEEIAYFFPDKFKDKVKLYWREYVVNWQAGLNLQLEKREADSILELTNQLSKRNKSTIKH